MDKIRKQHLEWTAAIAVDAAFILTGITLLIVSKTTQLPDWPWAYVGFFIAAMLLLARIRDAAIAPPASGPEIPSAPEGLA